MKDLNYYKNNCEEDYIKTPISVLRYITELEKNNETKQLTLTDVVKSLPSIVEINFDGNLKCQIETTDKSLTVLKAVNGYGNSVDCNKDKTIITII
jgi:PII-like signaling protein